MRRYNRIPMNFYTLTEHRALTNEAKSLLLYFGTNGHSNLLGCYHLPMSYIAHDLQWDKDKIKHYLAELIQQELVGYDEEYQWVWVKPFLSWNPIHNLSQGQGLVKRFNQVIPYLRFYHDLVIHLRSYDLNFPPAFIQRLENICEREERLKASKANLPNFILLEVPEVKLAVKSSKRSLGGCDDK